MQREGKYLSFWSVKGLKITSQENFLTAYLIESAFTQLKQMHCHK